MNRLLLGLSLLVTAVWLARADDKAPTGPGKIHRARVDWTKSSSAPGLGEFREDAPDMRRFDLPSHFPQNGLLGHALDDGPPSTGERTSIDDVALKFVPAEM